MSAVPSEYHGSRTQSWPQPTVMPMRLHLLDPGQAAALREGVVPALQHDVDQRVRDRRHLRLGDQRQAAWRRSNCPSNASRSGGDPTTRPCKPEPLGLVGQRLDVARHRVVGLVAMHVDQQAALGGDLAERRAPRRAPSAIVRSKCGMPPTTSTPMSSARTVFSRAVRIAVEPVLREGDELQVEVGLHLSRAPRAAPRTPSSRSSQVSTWLRIASSPWLTAQSQ